MGITKRNGITKITTWLVILEEYRNLEIPNEVVK